MHEAENKDKCKCTAMHSVVVNDRGGTLRATREDFHRKWTDGNAFLNAWDARYTRVCVCVTWVERLTRAREGFLCRRETLSEIAVDNTTIQRAWHARRGFRRNNERKGRTRRGPRGDSDDEGVDFEQTEISPILEGWLATPQFARLSSCGLDSTTARDFTLVYHDDALPSLPPSLLFFL